ncbi:TetR/AcrR family transcriptional regulator [Streptomyces bottropensis]|uniref:TetR/AcrR family transcriptional regulator n=1 Tax=Streptomyces bottropensis TaxID=42235 RepID=UPI00382C3DF4
MYVAGRTPLDAPGPGRPSGDSAAVPAERDVLLRGLEAFSELGYDRASARELARRLGVSHTFINDRYGSKAAFWRAVVDAALGDQLTRMTPAPPGSDDEDVYGSSSRSSTASTSANRTWPCRRRMNSHGTPSGWTTSISVTSSRRWPSSCPALRG